MNIATRLIATSALVVAVFGSNGIACSPEGVESAAEITDRAEVILLVKVPDEKIERVSPISMTVLEVLKGDFKASAVVVDGETARYEGANDLPAPYDFVRPGGRSGDCFADDYKPGGQFLLFLRHGTVHWSPLAATNEEVSGPSDPWVTWVKERLKNKRKA